MSLPPLGFGSAAVRSAGSSRTYWRTGRAQCSLSPPPSPIMHRSAWWYWLPGWTAACAHLSSVEAGNNMEVDWWNKDLKTHPNNLPFKGRGKTRACCNHHWVPGGLLWNFYWIMHISIFASWQTQSCLIYKMGKLEPKGSLQLIKVAQSSFPDSMNESSLIVWSLWYSEVASFVDMCGLYIALKYIKLYM